MYDKMVINYFIENQEKLLGKKVFLEEEEASEFLEDCMAEVCNNIKDVRDYLDESGMDVDGMKDRELLEAEEVFRLPNGKFLVVVG